LPMMRTQQTKPRRLGRSGRMRNKVGGWAKARQGN
jgi:hypothetical protein